MPYVKQQLQLLLCCMHHLSYSSFFFDSSISSKTFSGVFSRNTGCFVASFPFRTPHSVLLRLFLFRTIWPGLCCCIFWLRWDSLSEGVSSICEDAAVGSSSSLLEIVQWDCHPVAGVAEKQQIIVLPFGEVDVRSLCEREKLYFWHLNRCI